MLLMWRTCWENDSLVQTERCIRCIQLSEICDYKRGERVEDVREKTEIKKNKSNYKANLAGYTENRHPLTLCKYLELVC